MSICPTGAPECSTVRYSTICEEGRAERRRYRMRIEDRGHQTARQQNLSFKQSHPCNWAIGASCQQHHITSHPSHHNSPSVSVSSPLGPLLCLGTEPVDCAIFIIYLFYNRYRTVCTGHLIGTCVVLTLLLRRLLLLLRSRLPTCALQ